ncbi:MAG: DUF222 domain-containing protein [Actinobacteria bacterium]|nr:DUF222 domain-containing protein [Actinomycetota bacterium]
MRLSELRRGIREYASAFDPALMSARDAARVRDEASAIKKSAAAIEALAAARVAETSVWKKTGERSAAHELAAATGTSIAQAKETLDTGRLLSALPATSKAVRRGDLSMEQASLVVGAASADPEAEKSLLETSRSGSLGELRDACARTKANACDREERRRRIHERRGLRSWVDGEGTGQLHLNDNPERVAEIMGELAPTRDRLFKQARKDGRRESSEAYAADALHRVVCRRRGRANAPSGTAKVLVRVDLERLLSGAAVGDEVCEIAGYGPVAVSAVQEMLETGDPFLAAIVIKGKEVVGVAHLGRRPNAHQRSALEWLYPTCAAEGCNALTFLEFDHRDDWATTHRTVFDLLDRLCSHHHDLKTRDKWALVDGQGKRAFVAPDDPRHPRSSTPLAAA